MKTIFILLLALVPAIPAFSMPDPGEADTVRIDSVVAQPGEQVALPVYFYNDEPIGAVELVIHYDASFLTLDTFSLDGGRLEYIDESGIVLFDSAGIVDLPIMDWVGNIVEGNGLLCNLIFDIDASAAGMTFVIDSTHRTVGTFDFRTAFADTLAMSFIYPQFVKGYITVANPPPSPDSIWIAKVVGAPGQTIEVPIYGFNHEDIMKIDLAIEWSSDNLIYKSVVFNDTRGDSAWRKIVNPPAGGLNQLLITLDFQSETPLHPGSGALAKVVFDIASSAPDEIVIIDSSSYLGAQPLDLCPAPGDDTLCFAPNFTAGQVEIRSGTAVEEGGDMILPKQYALAQNVPNPFNPSTEISFELPKACDLRLDIYNILGQNVRTLVDGRMSAGRHSVTFDGRGDDKTILASGVYFYRLVTEEFTQSRKMTLMK
jgi:hypothetical protein